MKQWAWRIGWCAGAALVAALMLGRWAAGAPEADGAGGGVASVVIPDVECGMLNAAGGGEHAVSVTIINRGKRPVRLVGGSTGCGVVCHRIDVGEPVFVPPGATARIRAFLKVRGSGSFNVDFEVFVDDGNLRSVHACLRGNGTPS